MTAPQLVVTAGASVCIARFLGLIDYETRSVWQLFTAENTPFMPLLTAVGFVLLGLTQLGMPALARRLRRGR